MLIEKLEKFTEINIHAFTNVYPLLEAFGDRRPCISVLKRPAPVMICGYLSFSKFIYKIFVLVWYCSDV